MRKAERLSPVEVQLIQLADAERLAGEKILRQRFMKQIIPVAVAHEVDPEGEYELREFPPGSGIYLIEWGKDD